MAIKIRLLQNFRLTNILQDFGVTLLRLTSIVELPIAEVEGFEPSVRSTRTTVFKTVALSHSATPPYLIILSSMRGKGRNQTYF